MEGSMNTNLKQFVVFLLGKEEYGVDIQKVTTIEKIMTIARVPKTPDYIRGVINLRGEIIPTFDLRKKFGLPQVEETEDTRIIIVKIEEVVFGIIVDAVMEVLQLDEEAVESITNITSDVSMDYILGVGKIGDRIVTLLNLEKLIVSDAG
ncbi:MAG: chemotaxis protein CheW [Clostridia bacterium]|nr:chemotaxis protein CheW [Clostridia bacterium]